MASSISAGSDGMYMRALVESQQLRRKEQAQTRHAVGAAKVATMKVGEAVEAGEYADLKRERTVAWVKAGVAVAKTAADVGSAATSTPSSSSDGQDKWAVSPDKWKKEQLDTPEAVAKDRKDMTKSLAKTAPDVVLGGEDTRREVERRGRDELRVRTGNSTEQLDSTKSDVQEAVEKEREIGRKLLEALSGQVES